jgi:hypothetical protein
MTTIISQTPLNIGIAGYIISIVLVLLFVLIFAHVSKWKSYTTQLKILQTHHSAPQLVYDLVQQHLPLIYQNEMEIWEEADLLTEQSLDDIKELIKDYPNMTQIIKRNLAINNKPFTYDWIIDIKPLVVSPTDPIFIIKQKNYLQLLVCVTGICKVLLIPPHSINKGENYDFERSNLGNFNNFVCDTDITAKLEIEPPPFEFVEVVLRFGNMIYIPFNWYYHIYNVTPANKDAPSGVTTGECIIMDCINRSLIDSF